MKYNHVTKKPKGVINNMEPCEDYPSKFKFIIFGGYLWKKKLEIY